MPPVNPVRCTRTHPMTAVELGQMNRLLDARLAARAGKTIKKRPAPGTHGNTPGADINVTAPGPEAAKALALQASIAAKRTQLGIS